MKRAVVIGGGWAGCSAAWELSKRGFQVILIEKGKKLGGRAGSKQLERLGLELDCGQHLFLGAYQEMRRFLREIGSDDGIRWDKSLGIDYYCPQKVLRLQAWPLPGALSLLGALFSFEYLNLSEKWEAARFGLKAWRGLLAPKSLEAISGMDWLKSCGQSEALCRKFWQPLSLAALNARLEEVQASLLAVALKEGFLKGGATAALGLPERPLSAYLEPALDRALEARGGRIRRGLASRQIQRHQKTWHLSLDNGENLEADVVVLALPASLAAKQLKLELQGAESLESSPILTLHLFSEAPILPSAWGMLSPGEKDQGFEFHWAFDRTQLFGERGPKGEHWSLFLASAARRLSSMGQEAILRELFRQLAQRFNGFKPEQVSASLVLKEARATPKFGPRAPRPSQKTRHSGLALAGDWTDTGLPATIEGAVRSGRLATEALD